MFHLNVCRRRGRVAPWVPCQYQFYLQIDLTVLHFTATSCVLSWAGGLPVAIAGVFGAGLLLHWQSHTCFSGALCLGFGVFFFSARMHGFCKVQTLLAF